MVEQNENMKTETKIRYYKNGKIEYKYDYVNGEKHGECIDYDRDGNIHLKIDFVYGERHGEFIEYYENGNVREKIDYRCDMRRGKTFEYYESGNIKKDIDYSLDDINGKYIEYYENGNVRGDIDYVNDKMHGKYLTYYESGKHPDVSLGLARNVKEKADYVNGQKNGKNIFYHENGQIMEERDYVIGQLPGKYVKSIGYDKFGFCTHRHEMDANGNIIMIKKWGRIYGTNGCVTYEDHEVSALNHIFVNPSPLKEGDIFFCEGRYYEITRGSLNPKYWSFKKSTNLQIRHLEWQLDSAYVEVIDDAKKDIIDCSVYKLKPSGNNSHKLTTKKNFSITVMNNAELVVKHKDLNQREKYLEEIIKGIDKKLYPDVVCIKL